MLAVAEPTEDDVRIWAEEGTAHDRRRRQLLGASDGRALVAARGADEAAGCSFFEEARAD